MIIDCHTHLGKNSHITATAPNLIASMEQAGIDKSLVFAGRLNGISNEEMLEAIAPYPDKLYGVAAYHRFDEQGVLCTKKEVDKLASLYQEKKIVAVKFYTGYEHFYPADVNWELSLLEEVGCPVIFHSGDCLNSVKHAKLKYAHPLAIDDVANEHPKMNLVIAHMGFPWVVDAAEVCSKNDNVYSDCSGFVYGKFSSLDYGKFDKTLRQFYDIVTPSKLLFGTDWPISDQGTYLENFDWYQRDRMSKTAQHVFKIKETTRQ
jgi:uncharacterized protein